VEVRFDFRCKRACASSISRFESSLSTLREVEREREREEKLSGEHEITSRIQ